MLAPCVCRRAKDCLATNMDVLHEVANTLVEKENMDGDELQQIIAASQAQQYTKKDAPGESQHCLCAACTEP